VYSVSRKHTTAAMSTRFPARPESMVSRFLRRRQIGGQQLALSPVVLDRKR